MVNYDGSGRMYMIDEAGTLYYDTGEPAMGIYIVSFASHSPPSLAMPFLSGFALWQR